jgi:anti-sigma factor RsiW
MICQPERVTGFVDAALEPAERAETEAHLVECEACRAQAEAERALRRRLLALPAPPLPAAVERNVRRVSARRRVPVVRWLVPLAAAAALTLLAVRQSAPLLAWQMARDHHHCFGRERLPAKVWAEDSETVMRWFEGQGTRVPVLPESAAGFHLTGARYCPFPDLTRAAHVYYRSEKSVLSVFIVARGLTAEETPIEARGQIVDLTRFGDITIGVVGERREDVETFARTFRTSRASLSARAEPR